jgi:hypothetical protein
MNISARLVISGVIAAQKEFLLSGQTVIIGRESANDLVLKDPELSRRHARITYQASRYYVEDLGSTNGTFLNDQRIQSQMPLNHGDVIRFGESIRLTYYGPAIEPQDQTFILSDLEERIETPTVGQYGGYQPPQYGQPGQYPAASPGRPVVQPGRPPESFPQNQGFGTASPIQASPEAKRSGMRIVLGCGCLLFLLALACGASLYLIDSFAPELLYCGVLRPVVEGLGFVAVGC